MGGKIIFHPFFGLNELKTVYKNQLLYAPLLIFPCLSMTNV